VENPDAAIARTRPPRDADADSDPDSDTDSDPDSCSGRPDGRGVGWKRLRHRTLGDDGNRSRRPLPGISDRLSPRGAGRLFRAPGHFTRTANRRDYALQPSGDTLLDRVKAASLPVVAIGKIEDLFAGRGVTKAIHTKSDDDGMDHVEREMGAIDRGFIFTNLV